MNRQLRYTPYIFALILMAGSVPSLTANRVYFSNKSNETIHPKVRFCLEHGEGNLFFYNTLELSPGADSILCLPKAKELKERAQSTPDGSLIIVDKITVEYPEGPFIVYSRAQNPIGSDDLGIIYKGDGNFAVCTSPISERGQDD